MRKLSPHARIVAALQDQIASGELRPGQRVPSTRQIVSEWGVAMATAAKALAVLREQGWVRALPGTGTIVLDRQTTVAEALAHCRNPELSPAVASLVFVVRPPTATPTGRYLGSVHIQSLLREQPSSMVAEILDSSLSQLRPDDSINAITRYFATYNLVCGPVVDDEGHLLGAVSVDDLLDNLLPKNWRDLDIHDGDAQDDIENTGDQLLARMQIVLLT